MLYIYPCTSLFFFFCLIHFNSCNHLINFLWTKSNPILHFSWWKSSFTQIYVTIWKKDYHFGLAIYQYSPEFLILVLHDRGWGTEWFLSRSILLTLWSCSPLTQQCLRYHSEKTLFFIYYDVTLYSEILFLLLTKASLCFPCLFWARRVFAQPFLGEICDTSFWQSRFELINLTKGITPTDLFAKNVIYI